MQDQVVNANGRLKPKRRGESSLMKIEKVLSKKWQVLRELEDFTLRLIKLELLKYEKIQLEILQESKVNIANMKLSSIKKELDIH